MFNKASIREAPERDEMLQAQRSKSEWGTVARYYCKYIEPNMGTPNYHNPKDSSFNVILNFNLAKQFINSRIRKFNILIQCQGWQWVMGNLYLGATI